MRPTPQPMHAKPASGLWLQWRGDVRWLVQVVAVEPDGRRWVRGEHWGPGFTALAQPHKFRPPWGQDRRGLVPLALVRSVKRASLPASREAAFRAEVRNRSQ